MNHSLYPWPCCAAERQCVNWTRHSTACSGFPGEPYCSSSEHLCYRPRSENRAAMTAPQRTRQSTATREGKMIINPEAQSHVGLKWWRQDDVTEACPESVTWFGWEPRAVWFLAQEEPQRASALPLLTGPPRRTSLWCRPFAITFLWFQKSVSIFSVAGIGFILRTRGTVFISIKWNCLDNSSLNRKPLESRPSKSLHFHDPWYRYDSLALWGVALGNSVN